MRENGYNKYLTLFIVILAFVDGMLVAQTFQGENLTPAEGMMLQDEYEQKISSTVQENPVAQAVPFVSQAPYGIWTDPWASFAEEACAYMAKLWTEGETSSPSKEERAAALLAAQSWEKENLGAYGDTDIAQTFRLLTEFYQLKAEISSDLSQEGMIAELEAGNILFVPVQSLDNPYYDEPGPVHHMLLIYDYEGTRFLTNDPGTLRGEAYVYEMQKILEAVQDLNGERKIIVVSR